MQRALLFFLFSTSFNLFGASNNGSFDLQAHIERVIREKDELDAKDFFCGFVVYGDFPSKDNPLYEQLVEVAKEKVNMCDRKGRSTLHHAAAGCSIELVALLARFGLRFDQVDYSGQIPLHGAACRSFEMLEFVLNNTPKELINKKDTCEKNVTFPRSEWPKESLPRGRAPLHYVLRIIEGGRKKSDTNTYISVDDACAKIELLHRFGADMNVQDRFWGKTVLHWSVLHPIKVMETLLQLKADPNIKDLQCRTVLDALNLALKKTPGLVDGDAKRALLLGHGARATQDSFVPKWRRKLGQQLETGARSRFQSESRSRSDASDGWRKDARRFAIGTRSASLSASSSRADTSKDWRERR
jgi:hypothetical protein